MQKRKSRFSEKLTVFALALIVMAGTAFSLSGCSCSESASEFAEITASASSDEAIASSDALYCHEVTAYSGAFLENGKNEDVKDVAAVLVENRSDIFLDRATIKYKYGDKTATFVVSGLPAGKKCLVLETRKMTVDGKNKFIYEDSISTFKDDVILKTEKLAVENNGNVVTVRNTSTNSMRNICVYYKNKQSDGNYLGGITYTVAVSSLNPGESLTKETKHFSADSEIVKYSFQEE